MKILSSFTRPHVILNLYDLLSYRKNTKEDILRNVEGSRCPINRVMNLKFMFIQILIHWLILWATETAYDPIDFKCYGRKKKKTFSQFPFTFIIWQRATRIFFKNLPFVFFGKYGEQWPGYSSKTPHLFSLEEKKIIADWNDLRMSKWWQKCHFWVNYPFKIICIFTYPPSPSRYSMDLSLDSGPPPVTTLPYTSSFVQFSAKDAFFIFQVH